MPQHNKIDHRQEVTNDVVRMIEEGLAPFQKPWKAGAYHTPYNTTSLRPYHDGNVLDRMALMMKNGWTDPRFVTYHQAQEKGWQVRKGEKGRHVEYWEFPHVPREGDSEENDDHKSPAIHKLYTVFNAAQVDGMPPLDLPERNEWEVIEEGERILAGTGADIRHDGSDRVFYRPSSDSIHLPVKDAFPSATNYYPVALHELAHWTGLNRLKSFPFDPPDYACEELRAELASLFIAAECGLPFDPQNSAVYMKSWIEPVKVDKDEIFHAASDAEKAKDYVLALDRGEIPQVKGFVQMEEERRAAKAERSR